MDRSLRPYAFHPDLEGLAFVGLYNLVGPYLPVMELQARWIAYTLAGHVHMPSRAQMERGFEACRAMRDRDQQPVLHEVAVRLARHAGVEPDLERWPDLERALLFGPLSPVSFRLQGTDCLDDALVRTQAAAEAFGAITCTACHSPRSKTSSYAPCPRWPHQREVELTSSLARAMFISMTVVDAARSPPLPEP